MRSELSDVTPLQSGSYRENLATRRGTREVEVRSEAQRVRGHHAAVLHHGGADGSQVLEELLGIPGAQSLDVSQDPLVRLQE